MTCSKNDRMNGRCARCSSCGGYYNKFSEMSIDGKHCKSCAKQLTRDATDLMRLRKNLGTLDDI